MIRIVRASSLQDEFQSKLVKSLNDDERWDRMAYLGLENNMV